MVEARAEGEIRRFFGIFWFLFNVVAEAELKKVSHHEKVVMLGFFEMGHCGKGLPMSVSCRPRLSFQCLFYLYLSCQLRSHAGDVGDMRRIGGLISDGDACCSMAHGGIPRTEILESVSSYNSVGVSG